jgi:hypothetical protein
LNTSLLAEVLPFACARKSLQPTLGFAASDSVLAYLFCETTKVLRQEGVLEPLKEYKGKPLLFSQAMADVRCKRLLSRMAAMHAASDSEGDETALVKELFPETRHVYHNAASTLKRWRSRSFCSDDG